MAASHILKSHQRTKAVPRALCSAFAEDPHLDGLELCLHVLPNVFYYVEALVRIEATRECARRQTGSLSVGRTDWARAP